MSNYPLASSSWGQEELQAIQDVIDSDMYSMGKRVAEFERESASFFGSTYSVMVNSGSSANLLMIASLFFTKAPKLQRGDEVIVPAVSWSTTYFPLQQYGLHVKFVDIDPDTLNIDLMKLKDAVSEKTKAILLVNLLGNPNDFDVVKDIIGERDILLLEDNCESMGAKYKGVYTGTIGVIGTFSTFFSHHISTMEGGFILTDDEELYQVMLALRAHGWTRNLPSENQLTGRKSEDAFEESFKFVLPGYNLRPLEMSGAIGLEQLKKLPEFINNRRKNAEKFLLIMQSYPDFRIQKEISESSWFGFSLIIEPVANFSRQDLIEILSEYAIECRPIVTGNFLKNKEVLKYFDYESSGDFSASEYLDQYGLFIGNHQYPFKYEFDSLIASLEKLVCK